MLVCYNEKCSGGKDCMYHVMSLHFMFTVNQMMCLGDITLQKALDICRASEAMTLQLKTISDAAATNVATESEIHSIGTKSKKNITLHFFVTDVGTSIHKDKRVLRMAQNVESVVVKIILQKCTEQIFQENHDHTSIPLSMAVLMKRMICLLE